jgi:hypothetical protein
MNHEKLRELTAFQLWLGANFKDLPTDSGTMTDRARMYLKESEPIVKNDKCDLGKIWTECTEPCDQCCVCDHYKV